MTLWHAMLGRWRRLGYLGWQEAGAAYCLAHGNSAAEGTLIGPQQREAVRAAGIRCALCGVRLVD